MTKSQKSSELIRWWDLPAALLLLATLFIAALRLTATHWTEHLSLVQNIAFLGALAGLALGQSRYSPSIARTFVLAYGLFAIPWQLGLTLGEGFHWIERLANLGDRLLLTTDRLLQQKPVNDNTFFLFLMATLFWTTSTYAGYSLTRYAHPWRAILPTGLTLVIIHAYDSFFTIRTWFLAAYLFFSLLLVARLHFLKQQNRWKQEGAYLPPYLGLDFIRTALLTTAVLVLFAWTAPALASAVGPAAQAWQHISSPWVAVRQRLSNAFSSLQASVGFVSEFYGDTLPLGRGNPLSDAVVLTVQAPSRLTPGVRYYWRDRVYDFYDGQWTSSKSTEEIIDPDNPDVDFPDYEGRTIANFIIKTFYPIQNLHTPPQPLWVNLHTKAEIIKNPDGTEELNRLEATSYLRAGEEYRVRASITSATVAQLRSSGTDYPESIKERYLQLPDAITPRTRQLAAQIATGLDNPYDIAKAITTYLRINLSYSDTVPSIPRGREPVDWVLFDLGQAFCNYYATAEIVMLRSLGIPSRLAVGYAQGERTSLEEPRVELTPRPIQERDPLILDTLSDLYTVRHRDAHAWPEVYFPGIGWVEFEPTAAQSSIFRPMGEDPVGNGPNQDTLNEEEELRELNRQLAERLAAERQLDLAPLAQTGFGLPLLYWGVIAVLGVSVVILFTRRTRRQRGSPPIPIQLEAGLRRIGLQPPAILRRWAYFASLTPLERAYMHLNRALSLLGAPPKPIDTPTERGAALVELLPAVEGSIYGLLVEYQAATYGRENGNAQVAQRAGIEIRNQSFLALSQRLIPRFQKPTRRRRTYYKL